MTKRQPLERGFELWRLFASLLFFGLSFGLFGIAVNSVAQYGSGVYPALCALAGLALFSAAIGILLRRAGEFILRAFRWVGEWLT